jgi:dTDP-4-dehydrorhamnose reductase
MPKYLIVGKNGTLGSEFLRLLGNETSGIKTIGIDRSELDITNQQAVQNYIADLQPEVVINCAAYNAVDKAEQESETANLINGTAVGYLAQATENVNATFIHYSTNYVFKGDDINGYKEDDQTDPQSAYGHSKLLGEQEALSKCSKTYVIRTAWLYGQPGPSESSKISYVDRILQLAKEKDSLEGVADQFGQPTWTHDLAKFTLQLIEEKLPYGIYHGTNAGQASWYTWAQEILKIKNFNIPLKENSMANFPQSSHSAHRPQYGILLHAKGPNLRPWQEALAEYLTF